VARKHVSRAEAIGKARAERLAIFVGLWPPTFVLLGKVLQDMEATPEEQVVRALEPEKEKVKA